MFKLCVFFCLVAFVCEVNAYEDDSKDQDFMSVLDALTKVRNQQNIITGPAKKIIEAGRSTAKAAASVAGNVATKATEQYMAYGRSLSKMDDEYYYPELPEVKHIKKGYKQLPKKTKTSRKETTPKKGWKGLHNPINGKNFQIPQGYDNLVSSPINKVADDLATAAHIGAQKLFDGIPHYTKPDTLLSSFNEKTKQTAKQMATVFATKDFHPRKLQSVENLAGEFLDLAQKYGLTEEAKNAAMSVMDDDLKATLSAFLIGKLADAAQRDSVMDGISNGDTDWSSLLPPKYADIIKSEYGSPKELVDEAQFAAGILQKSMPNWFKDVVVLNALNGLQEYGKYLDFVGPVQKDDMSSVMDQLSGMQSSSIDFEATDEQEKAIRDYVLKSVPVWFKEAALANVSKGLTNYAPYAKFVDVPSAIKSVQEEGGLIEDEDVDSDEEDDYDTYDYDEVEDDDEYDEEDEDDEYEDDEYDEEDEEEEEIDEIDEEDVMIDEQDENVTLGFPEVIGALQDIFVDLPRRAFNNYFGSLRGLQEVEALAPTVVIEESQKWWSLIKEEAGKEGITIDPKAEELAWKIYQQMVSEYYMTYGTEYDEVIKDESDKIDEKQFARDASRMSKILSKMILTNPDLNISAVQNVINVDEAQ